ncbi:MAG: hypothetical protein HYZ86_01505 [Candidatus Omnitrophica bacterium]|nr:hypothetical protein [Candidatus Omnitrophota bacterium]
MVYLFLGDDLARKDTQISSLKKTFFKNPQAVFFDYESLDTITLSVDILKKSLITLPVLSAKRLVVVRNVHQLKAADIAVLSAFLKKPPGHVDLVLESAEVALKGELKGHAASCRRVVFSTASPGNAFDMARLMTAGKAKEALKMLNGLYDHGTHPLQVMGALVWYWGKEGRGLGTDKFERGLKALEEADLNIKRTRLKPEYAVEKAVVELMAIRRNVILPSAPKA